ncbi:enterobactin synthase subunit EntD [Kluyvera sp. STS39-E]|uniref:enterobactin synthase subunit EntD n=1 Tax=Kluyvera sp. STS39-E TaxID=3234748 RepID=UPI0034C6B23C
MLTHHTTFNAIERIDFAPDTFTPSDLLWLPHHAQLAHCGKKRQTEHLAGRIAAVHALRAFGEKNVPGIGENRQPLWPNGLFGSISHCGHTAVAMVSSTPVGIDIEAIFPLPLAQTLGHQVATEDELSLLHAGPLPFPLALTLAFSAKESLYKALSGPHPTLGHFHDASVVHLNDHTMTLAIPVLSRTVSLRWFALEPQKVLTIYHQA